MQALHGADLVIDALDFSGSSLFSLGGLWSEGWNVELKFASLEIGYDPEGID